jgi:adenosine deaminase
MANHSVPDFSSFINQQIQTQEKIESYLWRLEALIAVATTTDDFYDLSEKILHNYFSMASDLIEEATRANQLSLNELLKKQNKVETL